MSRTLHVLLTSFKVNNTVCFNSQRACNLLTHWNPHSPWKRLRTSVIFQILLEWRLASQMRERHLFFWWAPSLKWEISLGEVYRLVSLVSLGENVLLMSIISGKKPFPQGWVGYLGLNGAATRMKSEISSVKQVKGKCGCQQLWLPFFPFGLCMYFLVLKASFWLLKIVKVMSKKSRMEAGVPRLILFEGVIQYSESFGFGILAHGFR